jgi:hypothetical protein
LSKCLIKNKRQATDENLNIVDVSKNKLTITNAFSKPNTAPKILYKNQTLTVKFPDGGKIPKEGSGAYRHGAAQT